MVPIDYLADLEQVIETKQNQFVFNKKCTLPKKKSASKARFFYLNVCVKAQL